LIDPKETRQLRPSLCASIFPCRANKFKYFSEYGVDLAISESEKYFWFFEVTGNNTFK